MPYIYCLTAYCRIVESCSGLSDSFLMAAEMWWVGVGVNDVIMVFWCVLCLALPPPPPPPTLCVSWYDMHVRANGDICHTVTLSVSHGVCGTFMGSRDASMQQTLQLVQFSLFQFLVYYCLLSTFLDAHRHGSIKWNCVTVVQQFLKHAASQVV